ncbi:MAG TPA: hypothetical protein VEC96_06230, partial [Anaerolineae bacterium]|nr:hypothetical protein [Anaerolineae bacterium]
GSDLAGEIRVSITNQTGRLDFATPAELPAGARKRFTLYILPNNFSRSAKIEFVPSLTPESGQPEKALLTQTIKLSVIPNDRYVIGTVMSNPAGLAAMNPPQLTGRRERADVVNLALAELPDRHEGLRIINALVLNDVDTSLLTPAQGAALSRWVAEGGRLVLGGGSGAARTLAGLPPDLQPVVLASPQEVSALPGLEAYTGKSIRIPGPFLLAGVQPVSTATILLDQAETPENSSSALTSASLPLIVELPFGAGHVDFIALDLSQSPFDAWAGVTDFAERLLSPGAAWPEFLAVDIAPQQLSDSQMYYPLTNLPSLDLPSIRFLGLLLAGYIILVGPANYLFLRWRDRLAWAWVTIPALTLIFAVLAYGVGFGLRGSDIIVNQISVLEMGADGQTTRAQTYVGIFSPRRQTYDIEVAAETLIRPLGQGAYDPWNGLPSLSGAMKVVQGQPAHIQGLAVDQWSMQSFMAETTSNEAPGLAAHVTATRDSLRGQVVNQSRVTWQDVVIVFNAQFQKLGDLAPGQKAEVHLDFQHSNPITGFGSYMLYQDEINRPTGPSREISFKQSVLDSTIFSGNRLNLSDSPLLIAWQENNSPLEIRLEGYQINTQETTILYSPLSLNFDEAEVTVPPGFSRFEILSTTGDASTCNYGAGTEGSYVYQGTAEIKVSLPMLVRQVQPHQLDLYLRTDGNWPALPTVELYDRLNENWVALEGVQTGPNSIKDIDRFYNQDEAAVLVRIANNGVNGGCLFLDLALEGQRS